MAEHRRKRRRTRAFRATVARRSLREAGSQTTDETNSPEAITPHGLFNSSSEPGHRSVSGLAPQRWPWVCLLYTSPSPRD
eukprot:11723877-Alexandrium_andersonii.AAC.1